MSSSTGTTAGRSRRGIPLQVSLVVLVVVLVLLGLTVSAGAVTTAMRNQLIERTDNALREAAGTWARPRDQPPPMDLEGNTSGNRSDDLPRRPPSPYFVEQVRSDGTIVVVNEPPSGRPDLSDISRFGSEPVTVGAADGGEQWRVIRSSSPAGIAIVGVPLTDVNDTVTRLLWLQLGIGIAVLAVTGGLGYVLVRGSLRPLRRVEATAESIAAGQLDQRVPQMPTNTEVGSLAESMNTMLGQIQTAFAATEASESQARASEENMRRFVADASHELRTPLTTIKGFSELYRQGAVGDASEAMARIEKEANRMSLLVEDLLMLARLDAHRPLENVDVDLLSVASDAVHAARAVAPHRNISLKIVDGPGVPAVRGDAARLSQIVTNLVGNAVRHTPDDASITIEVGTEGRDALLVVADTGPGIPEADRQRVFERFYRADESRQRGEKYSGGSGLGLSIVAALVAAHGGRVGVDSAPGHGARFWVRIPRVSD